MHFAVAFTFLPLVVLSNESLAHHIHLARDGSLTGDIRQRTLTPDADVVQARHIDGAPANTLEPRVFGLFRSSKKPPDPPTPPKSPTTRSVIRILYLASSRCLFCILIALDPGHR
jgi:hypothetical protein